MAFEVEKNSLHHKILVALASDGMTTGKIRATVGTRMNIADLRSVLYLMSKAGLLRASETSDYWVLTNEGLDRKIVLGGEIRSKQSSNERERIRGLFHRPDYEPLELTTPIGRPGAYDAFDCPSRAMGTLIYRVNPLTGRVRNHQE